MAEIIWTAEAETWLREIFNYIAQDNPKAALETVEEIYKKTQILSTHPEIGNKYGAISDRNVRIIYLGHYKISYLLKSNNQIDILGVFHGALDIKQYLF